MTTPDEPIRRSEAPSDGSSVASRSDQIDNEAPTIAPQFPQGEDPTVAPANEPSRTIGADGALSTGARFGDDELLGESLAQRLQHSPMSAKEAAHITRSTAQAMALAHQRGVIHRDLKPADTPAVTCA